MESKKDKRDRRLLRQSFNKLAKLNFKKQKQIQEEEIEIKGNNQLKFLEIDLRENENITIEAFPLQDNKGNYYSIYRSLKHLNVLGTKMQRNKMEQILEKYKRIQLIDKKFLIENQFNFNLDDLIAVSSV